MTLKNSIVLFHVAVITLTGCTTSSETRSSINASTNSSNLSEFIQLTADQIRSQIVGNTITGKTGHFKRVGTIEFWVHYAPDGTAKDRIKFSRNGRVDRANGVWRIDEVQDVICTQFAKRREGREVCSSISLFNSQFQSKPTESNEPELSGQILLGDQVQ